MAKKRSAGEKVHVKSDRGKGKARVLGLDERSGTYAVLFEKVVVEDGKKEIVFENITGYLPADAMAGRKGSG